MGSKQTQLHFTKCTCLSPFLVSGSVGSSSRNRADTFASCTTMVGPSKRDNFEQQADVSSKKRLGQLMLPPDACTKAACICRSVP